MTTGFRPTTMTAGALIEALSKLDPDRPVLVPTEFWYSNISGVEDDPEQPAATIETTEDYSPTQW